MPGTLPNGLYAMSHLIWDIKYLIFPIIVAFLKDEEIEAQRAPATCPWSESKLESGTQSHICQSPKPVKLSCFMRTQEAQAPSHINLEWEQGGKPEEEGSLPASCGMPSDDDKLHAVRSAHAPAKC